MSQVQVYEANYHIRNLTAEEVTAGKNVFTQCMAAKDGEKILIVTDKLKLEQEAAIFFEVGKNFSQNVKMAIIPPIHHHGEEPPDELVALMCQQNIILLVTTYSLSHTVGRHKASDAGARIASMPGITKDIIVRTLPIDYNQVSYLSKKIAGLFTMAESAQLTTQNGTDISFSLAGRQALADTGLIHNPRDFGNLPAGEAFIAPEEGKTNGVVVFDGAFADILIDEPIKVNVKKGLVDKIEGKMGARQLEITLASLGKRARNIAELGAGTNKAARLESSVVEVEKVYGTVHIALGNNMHFGGEVDVSYHADGVVLKPTLELDGKVILKEGEFVM